MREKAQKDTYIVYKTIKGMNNSLQHKFVILYCIIVSLFISDAFAEGTKTVSPTTNNLTALSVIPYRNSGSYLNCPQDNRINFRISNHTTENFYFGFSWREFRNTSTEPVPYKTNVYYRIRRPNGTVVSGPALWNPNTSVGRIDTYAQAVAGPNIGGVNPAGYTPLSFDPTENGEFWIEIYCSNDGGATLAAGSGTDSSNWIVSPFFDMSVAAGNTVYNGRVYSDKWSFTATNPEGGAETAFAAGFNASSSPNLYAYTDDQVVIRVNFEDGFKPVAYDVSVNSYGVVEGSNFAVNRRSINALTSPSLANGYKVFLNQPDTALFPLANVPLLPRFIEPAITGCGPSYKIRFDLPESGDVRLLLNLNGTVGFQAGTTDRLLEGFNLNAGFNELNWDGKDGFGADVANTTNIQLSVILLKGRYNLPIYDAEINKNGISVSLIAPISVPNATMYWDDSLLTSIGSTCDGNFSNSNNITGSGLNNSLVGSISPSHAWNGDGNFSNVVPAPAVNSNDTNAFLCDDFGNLRVINTWGWGSFSQEVFANAKKGCADLFTTIVSNTTEPNVGSQVTFTLTAGNNGPIQGTNIEVEAILPSGYSISGVTINNGNYNSVTGVWTIPTLNNGQTSTLTIIANVLAQGDYDFPVSILGFEFDPVLSNNQDEIRIDAVPVADISITKTIDNTNPIVGATVTFTINGINNGPSDATGAVLSDLLPTGYTYVSHSVPSGTYNPSNGIWAIGDVPNLASGQITITAIVNANGDYTNTASITSNELDTNLANNSSSVTPTVIQVSDLVINKTVDNSTPNVGSEVVFTINITNNGPNNNTDVLVTDLLPDGYTYISHVVSSGNYDQNTGQWTIGNLSASANRTMQITALVNDNGTYLNTATVVGTNFDNDLTNNSSNATTNPVKVADLEVTKTVNNTTPNVGDTVIFAINLKNNGPSNATNVIVTDIVPSGYTLTNVNVTTGTYFWGTGIWNSINITSGQTVTLTLTCTVKATGNYLNSVTITSSSAIDTDLTNNTATAATTPIPVSDLSITKTVDNSTPDVGSTVQFTLVAYNNGPSDATNVQVSDLLPSGYSYVSHNATSGTYNPLTGLWNIGNFPSINNRNLTINAIVKQSGDYLNTATITANENDPDLLNNTSSITTIPVNKSDITVLKSVSDPSPYVGNNVIFTIDVINNGPSDVSNLKIEEILTDGYTLVNASTGDGFFDASTGVWTIGNLENGGFATANIEAKVNATGDYSNTASTKDLIFIDPNPSDNTSTVTTTPIALVDVQVNKVVNITEPLVGDAVRFTITVTNNGPSTATNVVVAEALPTGYTLINNSFTTGTWNLSTWNIPILNSGQTATMTLDATVRTSGDYCNTASAFTTELDADPSNNSSTACTTPIPYANLAITKIVDVATPNVGNIINFTLTVTNNGPINATNVLVNDILPSGYTILSNTPSVGSYNTLTGIWSLGTLNNTASATLNMQVIVNASGPYINTAVVTSDLFDPILSDNTAVSSPVVGQIADLSIVKTVNNSTPQVGSNVVFTLTARNFGASNATGVRVQDLLPSGYTYVSSTPPLGTSYNNINGLWTIGNLTNGSTSVMTITATVRNTGNYNNIANIFGNQSDNNTLNNISSSKPNVVRAADLGVTKIVNNPNPIVGENVIFTMTATNNGQSNATGVIVTDLLPSGYQFISSNVIGSGVYNNGNGRWIINNLINGGTSQLQIIAKVLGSGDYTNTATIDGNEIDTNATNDSASASTTPVSSADLAISNNVNISTPIADSNVIFTLVATNNGLSDATGVTVTNTLPNGYEYVSNNSSNGTFDPITGIWNIGNLTNGKSEVLEITVKVLASGDYTDNATITGNEFDIDLTNNSDNAVTGPLAKTDVQVIKTVNNMNPNVGSNVIFTISVNNNGPSEATNVEVLDVLQSGFTFVSANSSVGTYNPVNGKWFIGNLNTTDNPTLQIEATVKTRANYINTASVSLTEYDSNFGNNSSTIKLSPIENADLSITKIIDNTTPQVGSNVIFTLTATNVGPSAATDVRVTDLLPTGYSFVSFNSTSGTTYNNVSGVWSLGNLNVSTSKTLQITAKVNPLGNYFNSALINAIEPDFNTTNNSASATSTPVSNADLSINKEVNISDPDVNGEVIFTINVINNGPSQATNVIVNDLLPDGYSYNSSNTSTGSYDEVTGNWNIGTMNNGATNTLEITATVLATGNFTNTATVTASENDPNTTNNTSSAVTTPWPLADVGVQKMVDIVNPQVGTNATFIITATNYGPSDATGTTVTDFLPNGYSFVSSNQASYDENTGVWSIGALANGNFQVLEITATVNTTGLYKNTASILANENDTNTNNSTASATTNPVKVTDLEIAKSVSNATPLVGNNITFTLVAKNNGISNATNVKVQDLLPDGYMYLSHTSDLGTTYNVVQGTWNIGSLNVSETKTITILVRVNDVGNYENIAEISGNELDTNLTNNIASVSTTPKNDKKLFDDFVGPINGYDGALNVINVLDNDIFNNLPVTLADVQLTELVPDTNGYLSLQPDGSINVIPTTPAGLYSIIYQLCDLNDILNCDTATASVEVVAPLLIANDDDYTLTTINGATGFDNLFNVYSNDVYNSQLTTSNDVTITLLDPTNTDFSIDSSTGAISVNPNLGAGTYSFEYQLCDNLNITSNCDTAIITVKIDIARVSIKALLQGSLFGTSNGIMRDDLRNLNVIPLTEPYTELGLAGNTRFTRPDFTTSETTTSAILNTTGNDAIVDWVFVELRDSVDNTVVIATKSALIQRDGNIVDSNDGVSPLVFNGLTKNEYYITVKHRNHIGVMTSAALAFNAGDIELDFSSISSTLVWNSAPMYEGFEQVQDISGKYALWGANTNSDRKVKYTGLFNDQEKIFTDVINFNGTTNSYNYDLVTPVYLNSDINMDGKTKYRGLNNDSNLLFINVVNLYNLLNVVPLYNYDLFIEQIPN